VTRIPDGELRDIFVSRFGCDPRQRVRTERADARGTRWHGPRASALLYTATLEQHATCGDDTFHLQKLSA